MPTLTQFPPNDYLVKQFGNVPVVIAAGQSLVVDARGMQNLSVITGGGTANVSRVDTDTAGADSADTAGNQSVASATKLTISVDWSFYRVTAITASCRVCCP